MKMIPLSDIAKINPRLPKGALQETQKISFVPMAGVSEDGKIINKETRLYSDVKKGFTCFQRDDVLLAKITPCFENKKSALADEIEHSVGFGSTEFHVLRAIPRQSDPSFLYHLVRSKQLLFLGKKSMQGAAGHKRVPAEFLENYSTPDWSLRDQIRIAHLLGKVEALIAQRKQHLKQLDDLLKSVFLKMFAPQTKGYSKWPLVEIKDLAEKHKGAMRTGPFGSNLLHSEFMSEGEVAVLGIDNAVQNKFSWAQPRFITKKKYQELESYRIFPEDVIVTIMGTIGRSAVVPDDIPLAINTKHLAAITLNKKIANPLFVSYSIHSSPFIINQFKSKNRGAIMSGLNLGIIRETKLKRPPIELQNQFAAIHRKIDEVKQYYQKSLTDLEALYGTLSQKAFKGDLDLSKVPLIEDTQEEKPQDNFFSRQAEASESFVENEYVNIANAISNANLESPGNTTEKQGIPESWLEAYLNYVDSNSKKLNMKLFLQVCTEKWGEMFQFSSTITAVDSYEKIKKRVFEKLSGSELIQQYNEDKLSISLKGATKGI